MALQRNNGTSSLMNAVRNADNVEHAMERRIHAKTAVIGGLPRAALGNISNKTTATSKADILKKVTSVTDDAVKPVRASKHVERQASLRVPVKEEKVEIVDTHVQPKPVAVPALSVKKDVVVPTPVAEVAPMSVGPVAIPLQHTDVCPMDTSCNSQGEEAFSKQMWKMNIADIDQDDGDNPQLVSEYVNDIYDYMRELERAYPIRPQCLSNQTDINGRMRGILIDWLVQVHLRFRLLQETLFLTVAILDRYLQLENVTKSKLQLVGVTSMWIAAKYEEMYAPEVADFVYITDNAYSKVEIRTMECHILKTLDFLLGRPLAIHFLRRNSKAGEVDATTHTMAKYLMELTIVDYDIAHCNPSEIAAAALCLSMKLLSNAPWSATLVHYSKYTEEQLQPLLSKMAYLILHAGTGKLVAIKSKYQSSKFMRISKFDELDSPLVHELAARLDS